MSFSVSGVVESLSCCTLGALLFLHPAPVALAQSVPRAISKAAEDSNPAGFTIDRWRARSWSRADHSPGSGMPNGQSHYVPVSRPQARERAVLDTSLVHHG